MLPGWLTTAKLRWLASKGGREDLERFIDKGAHDFNYPADSAGA
jgi:hypothetical protein